MQQQLEAEAVQQALQRLGNDWEAVECHGRLVGLYCARGGLSAEDWLAYVASEGAEAVPGDLLAEEASEVLVLLLVQSVAQLNDSNLGFAPLLPAEEEGIAERVAALGLWCQGFLLGMTEGGVREFDALPTDSAEILRDLVDIARAETYEVGEDEDDEEAYAELVEYVRTGVLLINEELHPTQAAPIASPGEDVTYH